MNLEEQCHAEEMLRKIERVEAERDNAWTELREIRAAISANQEESTLDEVVKLRQQLTSTQEEYGRACHLVAKMHFAATGEVTGQKLGVVEDVAEVRQQLAEREKQVTLLRNIIEGASQIITFEGGLYYLLGLEARDDALAATELITNTRRRNADDMGNPPANAADLLNAWKPKP